MLKTIIIDIILHFCEGLFLRIAKDARDPEIMKLVVKHTLNGKESATLNLKLKTSSYFLLIKLLTTL